MTSNKKIDADLLNKAYQKNEKQLKIVWIAILLTAVSIVLLTIISLYYAIH